MTTLDKINLKQDKTKELLAKVKKNMNLDNALELLFVSQEVLKLMQLSPPISNMTIWKQKETIKDICKIISNI